MKTYKKKKINKTQNNKRRVKYNSKRRVKYNSKQYTKKGGSNVLKYESEFTTREDLPKIMYDAMTCPAMNTRMKNKFMLMNLDNVDLIEAEEKKKITLTFRFYEGNEYEIKGNFGGLTATPAYSWAREKPSLLKIENKFEEMNCTTDRDIECIKTTPCKTGKSKNKLFFCKARDLGNYINLLNLNMIDISEHNRIFEIISTWDRFKNHNMDIPVLHFK